MKVKYVIQFIYSQKVTKFETVFPIAPILFEIKYLATSNFQNVVAILEYTKFKCINLNAKIYSITYSLLKIIYECPLSYANALAKKAC